MKNLISFYNSTTPPEKIPHISSLTIHKDAYSSGQISSKLWLCRELEKQLNGSEPQTIWVLGGWLGLLSFLLLSRERINIKNIYSFDLDSKHERQADLINENWIWMNQKFKAKTMDCSYLDYNKPSSVGSEEPDLIINTSVEHFAGKKWFSNIPFGKMLALQSCNMEHEEHISLAHSETEFKKQFPLSKIYYSGTLEFNYPSFSFARYMLIGVK